MPLSHHSPDHAAAAGDVAGVKQQLAAHSPALSSLLRVHPDVRQALDNSLPVVALESTIIAHGMPYPSNYETALALHAVVRRHGAVPATIAVLSGHLHVGLTDAQLHQFAYNGGGGGHQHGDQADSQNKQPQQPRRRIVRKLGLRELSHCLTAGTFNSDDGFDRNHNNDKSQDGATTVSATMYIAGMVGIDVFATGGIGGVHRGVTQSWDVSADIHALATLPVLVVCAGVKAILDIDKTLQALESACVPVLVLGSQKFPAFYTADSGTLAPATVLSAADVAAAFDMHRTLALKSGMLLAVPIPKKYEPDAAGIQQAIEQAVKEVDFISNNNNNNMNKNMQQQQQQHVIKPQDVTPVLLKRVTQLTGGQSLQANIALVKNNAAVAAQIAVQLTTIRRKRKQQHHHYHDHVFPQPSLPHSTPQSQPRSMLRNQNQSEPNQNGHMLNSNNNEKSNIDNPFDSFRDPSAPADMAVIGATVLDVVAQPTRVGPGHHEAAGGGVHQSTALGTVAIRVGGVAWNVALAAARFSRARVRLLSAVGNDSQGDALTSLMTSERATCGGNKLDICAPTIEQRRGAVVSITHDDNGDLVTGVADTEHLYGLSKQDNNIEHIPLHKIWGQRLHETLHDVKVVVVDANLNVEDLTHVCAAARQHAVDIWLEPVSLTKSLRLVTSGVVGQARYMSPNEGEAIIMAKHLHQLVQARDEDQQQGQLLEWINKDNVGHVLCETLLQMATITKKRTDGNKDDGHERTVFVTRGDRGVSAYHYRYVRSSSRGYDEDGDNDDIRDNKRRVDGQQQQQQQQQHFKARSVGAGQVRNTCGAGDCFAGVCAARLSMGYGVDESVAGGMKVARRSCMSDACVPAVLLGDEQDGGREEEEAQERSKKNDGPGRQHEILEDNGERRARL